MKAKSRQATISVFITPIVAYLPLCVWDFVAVKIYSSPPLVLVLIGAPGTALFVSNRISTRRFNARLLAGVVSPVETFSVVGLAAPKPIANIRITGTFCLSAR